MKLAAGLALVLCLTSIACAHADDCHHSFSAECMKPYLDAARETEAKMGAGTFGGHGASIPTLSQTYGPIAPKGFRNETPVRVTGGHVTIRSSNVTRQR